MTNLTVGCFDKTLAVVSTTAMLREVWKLISVERMFISELMQGFGFITQTQAKIRMVIR
jgi:hypothetical protein